jgi:hypothetical protein
MIRMSKATTYKYIKWILAIVLILYVSLELIDYGTRLYYTFQGSRWYPARIERITGIRVPHYEVISSYMSRWCVEKDSLAFHSIPSNDMFDEIDERIAAGDTCWKRNGNLYSFHLWWDKECSPPKGEKYYTGDFQIRLTKGSKNWKIRYWDVESLNRELHLDEKNN